MNGILSKNLHVNYTAPFTKYYSYLPQVDLLATICLPSTFNVYYMGFECYAPSKILSKKKNKQTNRNYPNNRINESRC